MRLGDTALEIDAAGFISSADFLTRAGTQGNGLLCVECQYIQSRMDICGLCFLLPLKMGSELIGTVFGVVFFCFF